MISSNHNGKSRIEKQLQLYLTAVERSPLLTVITDKKGDIEFVNSACVDVTGYSAEELIGNNPRVLQSGEMSATSYKKMWNIICSGSEWHGRFHNKKKNGELYWESAIIIPIKNDIGRVTHYIAIKEDITRHLEKEKELVHAVKMEAAGQLSGGVAHDLNNLLTIISGNLQLLYDYISSDDEFKSIIEDARSATADGIELIRSLLKFSRKKPLKPEQNSINTLITQSAHLLRRMLGEGCKLVIEKPEEVMNAFVDLAQFESALINLCANSQDAMNGHGTIVIRAEQKRLTRLQITGLIELQPGRYIVVSVSDDGPGMDVKTAAQACDPFFTTKEAGKGTGLGLSMVYAFVTESGGALEIKSIPGEGTTVLMYFPESYSTDTSVELAAPELNLIGGSETILIVEDNELLRKFAIRSLKSLGYVVLDAADVAKAVDIFRKNTNIDLLFTDIVMPGETDGRALADWVSKRRPEVRIILTTGMHQGLIDTDQNLSELFPLVKKPYSITELASIVRAVLDSDQNCL